MNSRSVSFVCLLALMAAMATSALASGPLGVYYLTAGDSSTNWAVQGPNVVLQNAQNCAPYCGGGQGEYAIALDSTVRTLGNGNHDYIPGSEYTYGFVPSGGKYAYPVTGASFYDGTQDATHNYSVDYRSGGVYSFSTAWTNPQMLFSLGASGNLGITYDRLNNSLWISNFYSGDTVADYTLNGLLISSFQTGFSDISSLAMDIDGTLWMGNQRNLGTFYNYSTAGTFLGSVYYSKLADQNTLGGEIANTPEPGTFLMLGSGIMGLAGMLRRKLS